MTELIALMGAYLLPSFKEHETFEKVKDYQDGYSGQRIETFITTVTLPDRLYAHVANEGLSKNDMAFFFEKDDSITPGWLEINWKDNIPFYFLHHPVAVYFGDGTLVMNPCSYHATLQSAWIDDTSKRNIYRPITPSH